VAATSAAMATSRARNTILPFLLSAVGHAYPAALQPGAELWRLLQADPDRYLPEAIRRGVDEPLPIEIAAGLADISGRTGWDRPVPAAVGPASATRGT